MPRVHHFVLTNDKGRKIYGTCLTIYEEYIPADKDPYNCRHTVHSSEAEGVEITFDHKGSALYIPRVLCILSAWPYLLAFREYLTQLYRLATTTNLMEAPLERYIQNLCVEIPAPPPGAFEIELKVFRSQIKFWAPPAKLPVAYVALPYHVLFECLDLNNVMVVWYALLTEQKVVLLSSQYSILTVCAEILQSLMFPLQWSHLYVPLLPRFLSPMLDAPIPYLVGVIRENWVYAEQNLSSDTIVVDLDSNNVVFGKETPETIKPPAKKWTKLKTSLEETVGGLFWRTRGLDDDYAMVRKGLLTEKELYERLGDAGDAGWKERLNGFDDAFNMAYRPDSPNLQNMEDDSEQSLWEKVQESFLRFFVSTLKHYRKFMHVPTDTAKESESPDGDCQRWNHQRRSFDREGFVAWQKHDGQDFYRALSLTQQFDDFITKRLYSPGEPDVIFFDQNIDSKLNRSRLRMKKVETPFLLNAKAHKVLQTFQAVEPTNEDLEPKKVYRYESWPDKFNAALFGSPRPIPTVITAEFDRQAAVARLKASHEDNEQDDILFRSADFDPSPETAVFTVFFLTYCAVVGIDWQAYQRKRQEMSIAQPTVGQLEGGISGKGDATKTSTDTTAVESELSKEDEMKMENEYDAFLLCEPDALSGMIVRVPEMALNACHMCTRGGLSEKEFDALYCDDFGSRAAPAVPNEPNLLGMNDDLLAEYDEAKEIASAQLELAFEALSSLASRGLSADPDAFVSLMEACGRCGNVNKAMQLIRIMKRDGFVADSEIYSCFLNSFAHVESGTAQASLEPTAPAEASKRKADDAYSAFLKKKLQLSKFANGHRNPPGPWSTSIRDDEASDLLSESSVSDTSTNLDSSIMTDIFEAVFSGESGRRRKKKKRVSRPIPRRTALAMTDGLAIQFILGESLLTYLNPDLVIDTSRSSCPQCSSILRVDDIVVGWKPCDFQDLTSGCPHCKHRFVPHFTVTSSAPDFEGSQGKGTPLYCELLSPWVLRKELEFVIRGVGGVEEMLNPEWRSGTDVRASLWWNLVVHFRRHNLPVAFLLQGSFQNRLINPTP